MWVYTAESCDQDTCTTHTVYETCCMTILLWLSYTGCQILCHEHWWFHAFCLHIDSGCLSSLWSTHSSQDKEQSTTKLVLLQKAKTTGITRPPSSLAKQVSRATRQKVRNYGPLDNNMPFILSFLCPQCDSLWRTFWLTDSVCDKNIKH